MANVNAGFLKFQAFIHTIHILTYNFTITPLSFFDLDFCMHLNDSFYAIPDDNYTLCYRANEFNPSLFTEYYGKATSNPSVPLCDSS
ncbi:hypothetical protein J6590_041608 [Homalodisca vitripennis]|nr:hypothetical protein J6590_041608 [Homalodisca vitripennis]